ncbi:MAG: 30S ribosomal protein S17 [Candidatus Sungbacteria bacterium]|uniref:Small ribosomal subunit protein uS17 n=1 Tax=Candidatus Sungiibacteriota bacterium TaxID=2750080 RepID=A0A932YX84_9BACT|nr:30S ribosomal protein S17 [Candidatus Sungbacteria bacterium]
MRAIFGTIVSNRMSKTVTVRVDRLREHPKYAKRYRVSRNFKADVADSAAWRVGDVVRIEETRPTSKEKRWKVVELIMRRESDRAAEDETPDPEL